MAQGQHTGIDAAFRHRHIADRIRPRESSFHIWDRPTKTRSQRAIWGSKPDTTVIRMGDWSFYQIGVSENGGSPKSRNQRSKARTSEEPKNHPLSLSPFPSFCPMVRRPNGLSYFRAFGPKQQKPSELVMIEVCAPVSVSARPV